MERENLKSRLGFILLSAGCAIGIGNVWKFPYMAGQGGGGAFVLFYLLFLIILGLPIMTMEFAVGRASRKSPVRAYQALEKPGQKWHIHGYLTLIGCYLLMMFYTTVAGWMLHYFYMTATGKLAGLNADQVAGKFTEMLADPGVMTFWMVFVVVLGILGTYLNGIVLDRFIFGLNLKKRVCIISEKEEEIRQFILHTLHSGATIYQGFGAFDNEPKTEIITIVDKNEYAQLMPYILKTDPKAFVTVYTVNEIIYRPKR